ncbi:hypothetical protein AGLY_007707 [Aphis glycines]|uniref:Uncharacterized protein n=1 Tax=Aphis glycines TaxID=307491 RepID=A0A6G0TQ16_APHGL|nr:hypothetical protein AGLY_007707 [Aphis glycines]
MRCAEWPEVVRTTMAAALLLLAASTAAIAILEDADVKSANNCLCQTAVSASLQMVAIVRTHLTGYAPLAVSPDSITLSAPSRMAFATSEYSARVPRAKKTFSGEISIPRSPRATIIPSEASIISCKFFMPWWFSIFEIINISFLSFSDTAGNSTGTPGKLTPLRLPNKPPFSILHTIELLPKKLNYHGNKTIINIYSVAWFYHFGYVGVVNKHFSGITAIFKCLFKRPTFMPASIISSSVSTATEAGPKR